MIMSSSSINGSGAPTWSTGTGRRYKNSLNVGRSEMCDVIHSADAVAG